MSLPPLSVWDDIEDWLEDSGPDVLFIIGTLIVAYVLFRLAVRPLARTAMIRGGHPPDAEMEKRANTILTVIDRTAGIVVIVIGVVTILPEVGVNITAVVTGLGITGLALALGAQTLVRDGINGIFLLAEDQYRVGDFVKIAEVSGTVEQITLRRTIIRDDDGVVHSVPNGSISVVSNYTRDFAVVNVQLQVVLGQDLDRVNAAVNEVAHGLEADERYAALIVEPPRVTGIESIGSEGVTIGVRTRTRPSARFEVTNELRRRLAEVLLSEGIHVPYPVLRPDEEEGAPA